MLRNLRLFKPRFRLPYDRRNPIFYDKDEVINCYTDDYVMAMAALGEIRLVAMTTTSSVAPFNPHVTEGHFNRMLRDRFHGVERARKSGLKNIPDPSLGAKGHLKPPESKRVEDTVPLESPGARRLIREALRTSPELPLVVVLGGQYTLVADAYLMEPEIRHRIFVASLGNERNDLGDYNGWADPWAAFIALQVLRVFQFPLSAAPRVTKAQLRKLPQSPLLDWMLSKRHPGGQPAGHDLDAPPAISLSRRRYILRSSPMNFTGWIDVQGHTVPTLGEDPSGSFRKVRKAHSRGATREWWRVIRSALS